MKIVLTLLHHQWLSFWRGRNAGKGIVVQIFLAFIVLYFLSSAILLGLAMEYVLQYIYPGQNTIQTFCGLVLYYFSFDLLFRFLMQELPVLNLEPYITKNISKRSLVQYFNLRSLPHFLNLLPLLLFLPFCIMGIGKHYSSVSILGFIISIISIVLFNHFLIQYLKRKSILNTAWLIGILIVLGGLMFLDRFHVFSLRTLSSKLFLGVLSQPVWTIVFIGMAILVFILNARYLYQNLYLDAVSRKEKSVRASTDYNWTNRFGEMGELLSLEIKLILRNKRPRMLAIMMILFLFYGFLFYKPEYFASSSLSMPLFGALFVTGMFGMSYGNYIYAWQGRHMDFLLTSKISLYNYLKSKYLVMVLPTTVLFIISSFYGFLNWKIIPIQLAAFLFNVGFNSIMTLYLGTFNQKALDINQKAAFNYQGMGMAQLLYSFVIILLPLAIYLIASIIGGSWAGITAVGVVGLIALLFRNVWLNILVQEFSKRKYAIAEGFREK